MKSIQEAVASVQNAFPSIYTKDDVIKLLTSIESNARLTEEQIDNLTRKIVSHLEINAEDLDMKCIDANSAEFELDGNEISLYQVRFDESEVVSQVTEGIGDMIGEFFDNLAYENQNETV